MGLCTALCLYSALGFDVTQGVCPARVCVLCPLLPLQAQPSIQPFASVWSLALSHAFPICYRYGSSALSLGVWGTYSLGRRGMGLP